jgi:hypothetical protein
VKEVSQEQATLGMIGAYHLHKGMQIFLGSSAGYGQSISSHVLNTTHVNIADDQ